MVFGGSQVLMDIEPLIGILLSKPILHGPTHSVLGALIIGGIAAVIGKPVSAFVLRFLNIPHEPFTWIAAGTGSFVGTFSHILLDGIMHADMAPGWPFTSGNLLLGIISVRQLHNVCLIAGLIVLVGLGVKAAVTRWA